MKVALFWLLLIYAKSSVGLTQVLKNDVLSEKQKDNKQKA